ncbi:MAG: rRNA maturation RNase YbeY [Acholeplasmataceae bacterium]|jgi:probable rRNA maturation factor|nr:rRNA maturation RNase YbeY [Acholeplasmataceae bacterium]MDD4194332.1 rRNA maturation RNase YbeY [Acholeplasmataceae bacterium]MDY0339186.1 rRNA maturation RNase YbeY [Acholeplasmataceae bacterium]
MRIKIYNQTSLETKAFSKLLKKIFRKIKEKKNMSIVFVSLEQIQELNKTFRQIDKATDVLSFPNDDIEDKTLGDIFISLDKAKEQAESYGHSFEREVGFLAVHGYLHLIGYDHHTKEDEEKMIAMQENILKRAKLERKL